jgi:hypothetical protein
MELQDASVVGIRVERCCPFLAFSGATNVGNTRQEAAHSETAEALDLSGKEARSAHARQTAAKRG